MVVRGSFAGHEFVDVTNRATAQLTEDTYDGAVGAFITVQGGPIRFRLDGNRPSYPNGHVAGEGDIIELHSRDELQRFRAVADAETAAILQVSYSHG